MNAKPWKAEKTLSPEVAAAMVARQFPALAPVQLEILGEGWDNSVFLVNGEWVFRFPRRALALTLLEQEWASLDYLQHRLPVQVPRPRFRGQAEPEGFDWPFCGYALVPGQTACRATLSETERRAVLPALAQFLKTLHALSLAELEPLELVGDQLRRMDLAYRKPQLEERLRLARAQGLVAEEPGLDAWLQALPETPLAPRPLTLCHGDLYARHLVVNAAHELTGVIDWGDVHLGDPAVDLGLVYAFLPPDSHEAFWRQYSPALPVNRETRLRACFRGLYSCLMILIYAHDIGDQSLLHEGRQGVRWITASLPKLEPDAS